MTVREIMQLFPVDRPQQAEIWYYNPIMENHMPTDILWVNFEEHKGRLEMEEFYLRNLIIMENFAEDQVLEINTAPDGTLRLITNREMTTTDYAELRAAANAEAREGVKC